MLVPNIHRTGARDRAPGKTTAKFLDERRGASVSVYGRESSERPSQGERRGKGSPCDYVALYTNAQGKTDTSNFLYQDKEDEINQDKVMHR